MQPYCVAQWVTRWGNPASLALFDPKCTIFKAPGIEGIIGYRLEGKQLIVFGDPVCTPENLPALVDAFHKQFKSQTNNIIYVAASEKFMEWALQNSCQAAINIGNEIILDPTHDPRNESGTKASLLRGKYNQAVRNKVHVHEYCGNDAATEQAIEAVGSAWINARKGPQIYLHHVHVFAHREHKRWFYAQHEDRIVGVVILNRIDAHHGWVLSFSMTTPDAPKGTSEILIVSVLDTLRKEDCTFFSIGTVPAAHELGRIEGLGRFKTWLARKIYTLAKKFFNLGERHRYWKKFNPIATPTYVVLANPRIGIQEILGITRAFNAHM